MSSIRTSRSSRITLSAILWKSIWYGFIAGMISGMVKIGWEKILPPRTMARDATNPPQQLLQQLGLSQDTTHAFVYYSTDQKVFYVALIIHFAFAIVFAALYILLAQYWQTITLWQGAVYGVVIWIIFHLLLMPALGTVPSVWDQPLHEHISEFFGHIIWAWSIHATAFFLIAQDRRQTLRQL